MDQSSYIYLSYAASSAAEWIGKITLPILLYQQTHSAMQLSIGFALYFIPISLVSPICSMLTNHVKSKAILIPLHVLCIMSSIGLLFCYDTFNAIIYLQIFMVATCQAVSYPIYLQILANGPKQSETISSIAGLHCIYNSLSVLMPVAIGLMMQALFTPVLFLSCTLFYMIALLTVISMPYVKLPPEEWGFGWLSFRRQMMLIFKMKIFQWGCAIFFLMNFAINLIFGNITFYLLDILLVSSADIGSTISIFSVGALIGSGVAPKFKRYLTDKMAAILIYFMLCTCLFLFALYMTYTLQPFVILWSCICLINTLVALMFMAYRQQVIPVESIATVTAFSRAIVTLSIPLSSLLGGVLLQQGVAFSSLFIISLGILFFAIGVIYLGRKCI